MKQLFGQEVKASQSFNLTKNGTYSKFSDLHIKGKESFVHNTEKHIGKIGGPCLSQKTEYKANKNGCTFKTTLKHKKLIKTLKM